VKEMDNKIIKLKPEEDFVIVIDQNQNSLGYEKRKRLYLLSLPLMWLLTIWVAFKKKILGINPKINTFWFDGLSPFCRKAKEEAGTWRALELIYNFKFGQQDGIGGRISDYWFGMINAQAVRNRLKLVKHELTKAIKEIAKKEKEVRLLSLASGSAQGIIEVVTELKEIDIKVVLLDLDPTAIEYSRNLARKYGVEEKITFITGNLLNLERVANEIKPHIIEMVGFLDYRPHAKAVRLIRRIYESLMPGGRFITANICPNPEQYFLKWVSDWAMIYRRPEELGGILIEGGFTPENCRIICEPHRVHAVAICRKFA
jgi:SAM-dependent methyltransferase